MQLPTINSYHDNDDENENENDDATITTKQNTFMNASTSTLSPKYNYDKGGDDDETDDDDDDDDQHAKKPRIHIEYKTGDEKLTENDDDDDDEKDTYMKSFDDENKTFGKTNRGDKVSVDLDEDVYHDEDDYDDDDDDDENDHVKKKSKKRRQYGEDEIGSENEKGENDDDIVDADEEEDDKYFQKFRDINRNSYISSVHPECIFHCVDEISALLNVIRDEKGNVVDPLHRTLPLLTKYEKARVLGVRAKQLENGAQPCLSSVPEKMIDSYLIAEYELKNGKLPFIIRRPLAGGGMEYWRLCDLENLVF